MKLIKDIREVLEIIPVPMTSQLAVMKPYFSLAERELIKLIGVAQFTALVAAYTAPDDASEKLTDAVHSAQRMVVNLGYLSAIPILSVNIGSAGIMVTSNKDNKQAFSWQVDGVKFSLRELGYGAIEDLLELLEENPDDFPEYHASDEYRAARQYLIQSAADFNQYFNIGASRYVFHSLAYIMKRVEDQELSSVYGSAYIDKIKAERPTAAQPLRLLNKYIKPGIALLTAAKALRERIITLENGIATINLHGNYDAAKKEMVADKATVDAAYDQLIADAGVYLSDGLALIAEHPADFVDFVVPATVRRFNVVNDREKGIYAI